MPQHRGAKWCAGSDDRHTRQRGCDSTVSVVRSGNVQPRLRCEGGQVSRGRDKDLGVRLGIRQGVLESKQDLHSAIDETCTTARAATPVAAVKRWIPSQLLLEIGTLARNRAVDKWRVARQLGGRGEMWRKCHPHYGILKGNG